MAFVDEVTVFARAGRGGYGSASVLREPYTPRGGPAGGDGGRGGGRGSAGIASPKDRVPRVAEAGEPGEEKRLRVELRTVADLGLVGLPNAGKSTLLAALTAAHPKIADYPLSTLTPNLGVADLGDERFVVADIP